MILDKLSEATLFNHIDICALEDISYFCEILELDDGDILISENEEESRDVFILCSGHVEIVSNKNQNISSEIVLSSGELDILGELSWLLNIKRTATVRCKGEAVVIRIDGEQLVDYFDQHADSGYPFMKKLSELLAKRLLHTDDLLKQILWNINF